MRTRRTNWWQNEACIISALSAIGAALVAAASEIIKWSTSSTKGGKTAPK